MRRQDGRKSIDKRLGSEFLRNDIGMNAKRTQRLCRCRANGGDFCIAKHTRVLLRMMQTCKEMLHTIRARKDQPLIDMNFVDGVIQCRIAIRRRYDADHGGLDAGCAQCRQLFRQCRCLCTSACHKNALSVQWANICAIEPTQLLTQLYHLTDDKYCGRKNPVSLCHRSCFADGRDVCLLVGTRSPANDCRRGIGRATVVDEILRDNGKIGYPHQKNQRVNPCCEMLPTDVRFRLRRILMSCDDREGDGNAAMRHRDARIGRDADRRGHARQHLEGDAACKEYERLLAAAPKDKWIAALEANNRLPLIRFVRQQDIDILLPHRMLAGLLSDIDALCLSGHIGENALVREVVIDDDIRLLQAVHCANRQKARIARTRADKKYFSAHTVIPISFKISRPPTSSSSSARAMPIFSAVSGVPLERDRQTRIPSTEAIIASTWSTLPAPTSA